MQSLYLTAVFLGLMLMGFSAAFAAALGFVWVDVVKPQQLAYSIITGWPLSMAAALAMLGQYMINDRKAPPRFGALLMLILFFAAWVTLTTSMSTIPGRPWQKWDWAFKVMIFAMFIPFIFRSRVQIEAFILVLIFSAATIFCSAGVKTLLGGGGYGVLSIMGGGNTGLAEGSTLAVVCAMLVPLIVYVMRHNLLLPKNLFTTCLFLGIIVTAVATVIGTSARTGIIALGVLGIVMLLKSRNKRWWIAALAIAAVAYLNIDLTATTWGERMSTIESYEQDSSALGRIRVWEWTLDFVREHPLGGGFDAYIHNRISMVTEDGTVHYYPAWQQAGKAFHSIYFEVLGEQGVPGFIVYITMILLCILKLRSLKTRWKQHAGMAWMVALADALISAIFVFLAGGAFVGIAYQPFIFYVIGLTITLDQYSARVLRDDQQAALRKTREERRVTT
ncbi:putative O-glycosylation ligase, exosortase A system-associated [Telluria beijingensis]|uniref:putative O-glycosylation ligase, exosortase A system-associated n=1 Tax=Telluria beijingensis TaxID=3068633 RepID=UPI0027961418|nr:putative O-glycosylation ligase, exosortase A system-associated [Massilia sp. REN29]